MGILKQAKNEADIKIDSIAHRAGHVNGKITLKGNETPATIAHELFHYIDYKYDVSSNVNFKKVIASDYKKIRDKVNGVYNKVKDMLYFRYRNAFELKESNIIFKDEYRGISDILDGMTGGKERFGYGHGQNYWGIPGNLEKETWAQFGRILYDNNADVVKMARELFGDTFSEVETILREFK